MSKTILVTGATGHQGKAIIYSLLSPTSPTGVVGQESQFYILAVTRHPASSSAQALLKIGKAESDNSKENTRLELVQGDLDNEESIRSIFETRKDKVGIWGVYCVLVYPGLGANADGEERQGKMLADLAAEFGVSHYIYSSAERSGESNDDNEMLSGLAKVRIERHLKAFGEKGLKWTILRPVVFMENFEGALGKITAAVMATGLKPTTKIRLVGSEDIGHVAAVVFRNPEKYVNQIIVVIGDALTVKEQEESYKRATGIERPTAFGFVAKSILALNAHTRELYGDITNTINHEVQSSMEGDYEKILKDVRDIYPGMMKYETYAKKKKLEPPPGWNNLSLMNLMVGKN
ncbi:NAD(P)-binding protein [Hysterangium stoloniferum]|nr:NAD(P)-binding protein [Hysterangium stoloniferum]